MKMYSPPCICRIMLFIFSIPLLLSITIGGCVPRRDGEYKLTLRAGITTYKIESVVFDENKLEDSDNISIEYPKLSGLSNESLMVDINEKLKYAATSKYLNSECSNGDTYHLEYEVTFAGEDYLSIHFTGYADSIGNAHPTILNHAITLSLQSGDIVTLDEIFTGSLFENYDREIFSYKNAWQKDTKGSIAYVIERTSDQILSGIFQKHGALTYANEDFYLTQECLVLLVSTNHAMGDSLEFVANYADLQQWMDMDNPIWQQLE